MLDEAKKRDIAANAVLGAAFALSAAQSPKDFVRTGSIESPGVAMMQRTIGNPRRKPKDLDKAAVMSRGSKLKEGRTFKEFMVLAEMRKEDKIKGKQKTPLYLTTTHKKLEKSPEGKWERKDIQVKKPNPTAAIGRYKQGREGHAHYYSTEGGTSGGPGFGYRPVGHNTGGPLRGVKKVPGEKTKPADEWHVSKPAPGRAEIGTGDYRTPAKKVEDKKKKKAYTGYDYRKGFSGY